MSKLISKAFLVFSGYNQRAVIALCRQLTLMEIQFYVIALNENDPILSSNYGRNVKAIRKHNKLDLKEIIDIISKIKRETNSSTLVAAPSSEYLNHFLLNNRKALEEIGCSIPLVEKGLYQLITNKYSFSNLCKEHGIAIPERCILDNKHSFPFVAKPFTNINKEGRSLYPYIFKKISEISIFLALENRIDFYFEEYVGGVSYYLLLQFSRNKKVKSFSQKNILQQADGKSIILAEPSNIHTHPNSVKIIDMLQAVGFVGLIMIEVRLVNNVLCVIEANPRLWGPLQLLDDNSDNILSEFIKDSLQLENDLPGQKKMINKKNYFWFNGFVEMIVKNKKVTNYTKNKSILLLVLENILHDVYLRRDSFKIFFREFLQIVKG